MMRRCTLRDQQIGRNHLPHNIRDKRLNRDDIRDDTRRFGRERPSKADT